MWKNRIDDVWGELRRKAGSSRATNYNACPLRRCFPTLALSRSGQGYFSPTQDNVSIPGRTPSGIRY